MSETSVGLRESLWKLYQYCNRWELQINSQKSEIVVFKKDKQANQFFQVNGEQLNTVNKYKYFGIIITKNGNFKVAKETLANKGKKVAYSIKNSLQSENFESIDPLQRPLIVW